LRNTVQAMTDDSIVQHIADALAEHYGPTAAVEIAETLASVTSGSGTEFWSHVIDAIRARISGAGKPTAP
jgi:hypothetical protein